MVLVLLILAASLYCWAEAIRRWATGGPLVAATSHRLVPWDLIDVGGTVMAVMVIQTLAVLAVARVLGVAPGADLESLSPAARAWLLAAGSASSVFAAALSLGFIWLRHRLPAADVGVVLKEAVADLRLGAIAYLMLAPIVYAIQLVLVQFWESKHPLIELLKEQPDPQFFVLSGLAAVVVAPIVEEYFFRVLLQGWLEKIAVRGAAGLLSLPGLEESGAVDGSDPDPSSDGESPASSSTDDEWSAARVLGEERLETDAASNSPLRNDIGGGPSSERSRPELPGDAGVPISPNPYAPPEAREITDQSLPDTSDGTNRVGHVADDATWWRRSWPILVSSTLFALAHYSHGPDWVPLLVLALGIGYLYNRTHRILPCIVVHFLLNATSMAALLVEVYFGE